MEEGSDVLILFLRECQAAVGKRYRRMMTNRSGDNHPVHLHRHTFEVTKISDKATAGVMKDTINMTRLSTVEIDLIARLR